MNTLSTPHNGTSVKKEYTLHTTQWRTVDVPLCGVKSVFLLDSCFIVWCGMGIHSSVKKEYTIHTTQWNINSFKLKICEEGIPYSHHTMERIPS
jgi:hypothetical protein